ncbi:MAG: hypothetical protein M1840_002754 [Geoglossum simile]|nr:MAG: hypothetical protein M1840_002754 [Geoglossum simile]
MDLIGSNQVRVIIRVCVSDIPGDPLARHQTLGDQFCQQTLLRPFSTKLQASGYDHVHIPGGFDLDKRVNRWFIYDLNVTTELEKEGLDTIPHMVFCASRQNDHWWDAETLYFKPTDYSFRNFIDRKNWIEEAKRYCRTFVWGGRTEQELVAEMRSRETE